MNKTVLRLLILVQLFTLFVLMLMPAMVRLLSDLWGKALYALLVIVAICLALALRYALINLE